MTTNELKSYFLQHAEVTTDSRQCPEGSIFIALKGEKFNGNAYAAKALEQGCAVAVVDESQHCVDGDPRYVLVDDALQTLKNLARLWRRQFHIPVVAITGTNGKTTTKELVRAVLSERYNVMATEGNFNNDVGVPKTLLRLRPEHEIAIVEMGASHPGDIKTLVETAEPTCGLVTNVGRAHLQGFGSFEGVMQTKGELYDFLSAQKDSAVFIHAEDEHLMAMAHQRGISQLVTYSTNGNPSCFASGQLHSASPFVSFTWKEQPVETHLVGSYNLANLMAAVCVGRFFDVSTEQINHALSTYVPTNNRSQMMKTNRNTLVVDAYNANPTSMMAALESFSMQMPSAEDKLNAFLILGDMKELGESSGMEHQRIVDFLAAQHFQRVWLVGDEFAHTTGTGAFRLFHDVEEVKTMLKTEKPEGFTVFIKGSNSTKLYELPAFL